VAGGVLHLRAHCAKIEGFASEWSGRYARAAACCGAGLSGETRAVRRLGSTPQVELEQRAHMYAVVKTGGKQYKVAAGEKIKVEQIAADVGQEIVIDQVLAVGSGADLKVGSPLVSGASVTAVVVAHGRHDKVRIFKMRRRKHYQKHGGHRQHYTELQISAVNG
jgi:large subunit ribosomal protein L21